MTFTKLCSVSTLVFYIIAPNAWLVLLIAFNIPLHLNSNLLIRKIQPVASSREEISTLTRGREGGYFSGILARTASLILDMDKVPVIALVSLSSPSRLAVLQSPQTKIWKKVNMRKDHKLNDHPRA